MILKLILVSLDLRLVTTISFSRLKQTELSSNEYSGTRLSRIFCKSSYFSNQLNIQIQPILNLWDCRKVNLTPD